MANYHTLGRINEPFYMLGFSPLHLAGLFLMLIFVAIGSLVLANALVAIILISVFSIIIIKIGAQIAKNNHKGNPDYVESELLYMNMPKVVEDNVGVCQMLIKDGEND